MSKEEHRFPRWLLHPLCPDNEPGVRSPGSSHNHEDMDCATHDSQLAWNLIVNRAGLNSDMLVDDSHTDEEFVWTFERPDPPSDEELQAAKAQLESVAATIDSQIAVLDRALKEGDE